MSGTMAINQADDVAQRIIKGLKLNPAIDEIPKQVAKAVVPIFLSNIPSPRLREVIDATANDSDKAITVPSNKIYKICYGNCLFATDATVGDRILKLEILDELGNIVFRFDGAATQAASLSKNYTVVEPTGFDTTDGLYLKVPFSYLMSGWAIRVFDSAAIAPTTDDLTMRFLFEEYDYQIV